MAGNNNFLDLNNNRENLIRNYFCSGFTYAEICLLLNERHNLQISVPHLKRLLKRLDLRRRNLRFDVENVIYCINKELTESGSSMYYLPDLQEAENYKINFDSSLLGMVSSLTREKQPFGCETVFAEAFRLLLRENNWQMPSTNDEALELYSNLVTTCTEQVSGD